MQTLTRDEWREREARHVERARVLLGDVRERRRRGAKHPVEDFMFDYYSVRPGQLLRWSPGVGVLLQDAPEFVGARWHATSDDVVSFDAAGFAGRRSSTIAQAAELLSATSTRRAQFGCFGMHEWAMVYRLKPGETRHAYLPLRYPPDELAAIIEGVGVRCSHFDAFRFFTPDAVPLNEFAPTRERQVELDQPGCLHVNMDLYKWAGKLHPATSSELLLDCYELARDIREVDMRASAYDLADWGYEAIEVEHAHGRAQYAGLQRGFAERGSLLRDRLLEVVAAVG